MSRPSASFLRHFIVYAGADILASSITLLVSPWTTRLLSPAQYGTFTLLQSAWGMLMWVQYAGMDGAFPFFRAKSGGEPQRSVLVTANTVASLACVALWILVLLGSVTIPAVRLRTEASPGELALFVVGLIPTGLNGWYAYALRFLQEPAAFAKITVVGRVSGNLLALPLLALAPPSYRLYAYFAALLGAQLVALVVSRREFHRIGIAPYDRRELSPSLAREMLHYGGVLIPAAVASSASFFLDRFLVGVLAGPEAASIMGLAAMLGGAALMVRSWFGLVWNPTLVEWVASRDRGLYEPRIRRALGLAAVVFYSLVVLSVAWSDWLVARLYPPFYEPVGRLVPGIVFAGACAALSLVANATMLIADAPRLQLPVNALGLLVNFGVAWVLIPKRGAAGAVAGAMAAEVAVLGAWAWIGRFLLRNLNLSWMLPAGGAAVALASVLRYRAGTFFPEFPLLERIAVSILVTAVLGVALVRFRRSLAVPHDVDVREAV